MRFQPDYPLAGLTPAEYNPRHLSEPAFERLKESLRRFGVQKPVIVNADQTLVAGHQRTKALQALGQETVPAVLLEEQVGRTDEIRFNLMHNSIETEKTPVAVPPGLEEGWRWVEPYDLEVGPNGNAGVVKEICALLSRYGAWGSIVADTEGNVIANSDYAFACHLLNLPVLTAVLPPTRARELLEWLGGDYGVYSYGALGIRTYNQVLCQPHRLARAQHPTFERLVKPALKAHERLVDFGSGEGKAVAKLNAARLCREALCYEPHLRLSGTDKLDVPGVVKQISHLQGSLQRSGLFDVVVLDAVINSVTSYEFAHRVLLSCNALCSAGGRFYTSTRSKGTLAGNARNSRWTAGTKAVEFLDPQGFAANYRSGVWTLQLFMTGDELTQLLSRYFGKVQLHVNKAETDYLRAACSEPLPQDPRAQREALEVEFNMEYPGGYRHGKQGPLVELLMGLLAERDRGR